MERGLPKWVTAVWGVKKKTTQNKPDFPFTLSLLSHFSSDPKLRSWLSICPAILMHIWWCEGLNLALTELISCKHLLNIQSNQGKFDRGLYLGVVSCIRRSRQQRLICVKLSSRLISTWVIDPSFSQNWLTNKVKVMANEVNVQPCCALKRSDTLTELHLADWGKLPASSLFHCER